MKIRSNGRDTHLSYCTNVHPGERWTAHFAELREHVPAVRDAVLGAGSAADERFGIGLRLSARALAELEMPDAFARFEGWLRDERCYVYTVNGFPFGTFHGEPVKANVYRPDWSEPARLDYTCRLATLLARLAPPENHGTISTLPGTFKPWNDPDREAAIVENLLRAVAHCVSVERDSGVHIALAVEPEPCCLLETGEETIAFFEERLLSMGGVSRLAALASLSAPAARRALGRHLGVCHDVCHSAVEFEPPRETLARYAASGIEVFKLQLSSALRVPNVNEAALRRLSRFDEPVYLHQVVERRGEALVRFADLGAASDAMRHRLERRSTLDVRQHLPSPDVGGASGGYHGNAALAWQPIDEPPTEWRVHFHVPVFMAEAGMFSTTRETLAEVLDVQRERGVCRHLEVETYTWGVLPSRLGEVAPAVAIARELNWVRARL